MKVIQGRNMHEVFPRALNMLLSEGVECGTTIECHTPASLVIEKPTERLVYNNNDDLNPFASLFHALWVIGGRNDVSFFAQLFGDYHAGRSDDGIVLHGAYGHRIREHFPSEPVIDTIDQLKSAIVMLRKNFRRRDVVLELWDASADLGLQSRNLPSATHIYLSIGRHMSLDMMVMYREADIYNMQGDSIAFSLMQEFIAKAIVAPVGRMTIVINRLNGCVSPREGFGIDLFTANPYDTAPSSALEFIDPNEWLSELAMFLDEGPVMGMREPFLRHVASPMWQAWRQYKETTGSDVSGARAALSTVSNVRAADWRAASTEWITRRIHERTNTG